MTLHWNELTSFVAWEQDVVWFPLDEGTTRPCSIELPQSWRAPLLGQRTTRSRVKALWETVTPVMPRSARVYADKTAALALLRTRESGLSLVYLFDSGGDWSARRGFSPTLALPSLASAFPCDLMPFYRIHDGLVHLPGYDGGPMPSHQWQTVNDPDSGSPSLLKVAADGSEALGFAISDRPVLAYVVQPEENDVVQVEDAWGYLDDLVASRLETL